MSKDSELIDKLGICFLVKETGFSYQRIWNWKKRGKIPPAMKLKYPTLFLQGILKWTDCFGDG